MVLGGDFNNNSNLNGYVHSVYIGIPRLYEDELIHMRSMFMQACDGEFKGMSC